MIRYFENMLATFDYKGFNEFFLSLFPSFKYRHITMLTLSMSYVASLIDLVFGMTGYAFFGFMMIMVAELTSGIIASRVKKEPFSSLKLSRFCFKVFYYIVIISGTYMLSASYSQHGHDLAASAFIWLHVFFVVQIVLENIVSILENISVINGKDKTYWIKKIQDKINGMI